MKPILGHEIGQVLCDALGLPKNTVAFTLHCRTQEVVRVECEYYPEGAEALSTALMQFELLPRRAAWPEPAPRHPAEVIGFDAWMRERTNAAHAAFMKRTSAAPSVEWRTYPPEEIARYFGLPLEMMG